MHRSEELSQTEAQCGVCGGDHPTFAHVTPEIQSSKMEGNAPEEPIEASSTERPSERAHQVEQITTLVGDAIRRASQLDKVPAHVARKIVRSIKAVENVIIASFIAGTTIAFGPEMLPKVGKVLEETRTGLIHEYANATSPDKDRGLRFMYGDTHYLALGLHNEPNQRSSAPRDTTAMFVDSEKLGVDEHALKEFFATTFPKHWLDNVESIRFEPGVIESLPPQYGIKGTKAGEVQYGANGDRMRLFKGMDREMVRIYTHEIGHSNGWNNPNIPLHERVELLRRVTELYFGGQSSFTTDYVEAINNPDPQEESYIKIGEFWAEACQSYFSSPELLKKNHPEIYEVVDWWVKKTDPSFDAAKASSTRSDVLLTKESKDNISNLPESVRHEVMQAWSDYQQQKRPYEDQLRTRIATLVVQEHMSKQNATWKAEMQEPAPYNQAMHHLWEQTTRRIHAIAQSNSINDPERLIFDLVILDSRKQLPKP